MQYRILQLNNNDDVLTIHNLDNKFITFIGGEKGNLVDFDKLFNSVRPAQKAVKAILQGWHKKLGWQAIEKRYK